MNAKVKTEKSFSLDGTDLIPFSIWLLVAFITWTFLDGAHHYLEFTREALGKYYDFRWILMTHVTAGAGTLIFGTIQFWEKLRKYSYRIHRVIGLLYVFSILISSVSALILAFTTAYEVNWQFAFALQVWATAWISSTLLAYYHALRKRFLLHKEWMLRSYIVTIAFVIQGLLLKTSYVQSLGSLEEISASFIWMGWTVPLYLYEVLRSGQRMVRVT